MTVADTFELPAEIKVMVAALASNLATYVAEARESFDETADGWRDSTTGIAVDGWIDELGNLADDLENLPEKPE